jgi:group II intron reverse transcriptase/maturase
MLRGEGEQVSRILRMGEACEMQDAQTYLEIVRSRGERRLELRRVYRNLRKGDLFLRAYANLYANRGALTPGTDPRDTVDGMSLKRIGRIMEALKAGTYRWKPGRRTYIPKRNGKLRPLGMPSWSDKLLQEVIRIVLNAYYEPQFSEASHGFRPGRGCHTALRSILLKWRGVKWFIEGDIKGCFDAIEHDKLLEVVGRKVKDQRLLKLLKGMLKAGYLEDWRYRRTYSGVPQGGVISPMLANILLNELDRYVEEELIPEYTRGERRRRNPEYQRMTSQMARAKKQGEMARYKTLKKRRRGRPSADPDDPNYRQLKYVRYADDFLLGFIGPRQEAVEIKQKIGVFLATIGLTLSDEKTLVTNATEGRARFLGYDVRMSRSTDRPRVNGNPRLSVPHEIAREWKTRYAHRGKARHRPELTDHSDYDIVMTYNLEFQGLVNYYTVAQDVSRKLYPVKWVYVQSLVKTLAAKHRRGVSWVYRKYYRKSPYGVMCIEVKVPREGRKPLIARFGAKPIRFDKWGIGKDAKVQPMTKRSQLVDRLLTDECELCGSSDEIEVHHIHKLKDLRRRYRRQASPPEWVVKMAALRRKTLVVCTRCHRDIHAGAYDGPRLM